MQRQFIVQNSLFYNKLPQNEQRYFEHRILRFIEDNEFVSREGAVITEAVKLMIAATSIKLTFGYRDYLFSRVDRIIVYPQDYFSIIGGQQHKGETNPRYKTIVFSLKDFKEGNAIANDNLNLGLHEFTHAMHFSFKNANTSSARYFRKHYANLLLFMDSKEEQQRLVNAGYLREYAFENQYEFLAVLVEHFFETPQEFRIKLPGLFSCVQRLLNINLNLILEE